MSSGTQRAASGVWTWASPPAELGVPAPRPGTAQTPMGPARPGPVTLPPNLDTRSARCVGGVLAARGAGRGGVYFGLGSVHWRRGRSPSPRSPSEAWSGRVPDPVLVPAGCPQPGSQGPALCRWPGASKPLSQLCHLPGQVARGQRGSDTWGNLDSWWLRGTGVTPRGAGVQGGRAPSSCCALRSSSRSGVDRDLPHFVLWILSAYDSSRLPDGHPHN